MFWKSSGPTIRATTRAERRRRTWKRTGIPKATPTSPSASCTTTILRVVQAQRARAVDESADHRPTGLDGDDRTRTRSTKAIETISHQGEGSDGPVNAYLTGLAHYYRFAEMHRAEAAGHDRGPAVRVRDPDSLRLGDRTSGPWRRSQGRLHRRRTSPDPEARRLLRGFNVTYSRLLDLLQAAWRSRGGQAQFWHAIETMFDLEKYAQAADADPAARRPRQLRPGLPLHYRRPVNDVTTSRGLDGSDQARRSTGT